MSTNSFALVTYLPEHDGQRLTPKPCTARKRRPRSGAPLPILLRGGARSNQQCLGAAPCSPQDFEKSPQDFEKSP